MRNGTGDCKPKAIAGRLSSSTGPKVKLSVNFRVRTWVSWLDRGHAHLRRHNKIANTVQDQYADLLQMKYKLEDPNDNYNGTFDREATCRLCQLPGKEETPYHMAKEFLRAWDTRRHLLVGYNFENIEILRWDPLQSLKFFKHFDLENKPNTL